MSLQIVFLFDYLKQHQQNFILNSLIIAENFAARVKTYALNRKLNLQ